MFGKITDGILLWGIVIVLVGVVFHAPLTVLFGTLMPQAAELIKIWKEVILAILAGVVLWQVERAHQWRQILSPLVVRLSLGFIVLHIALVPFMFQGWLPMVAGLMIDLRFVVFFLIVYAALVLHPEWRHVLLRTSLGAAVVSLGFALLQVTVLPHDALKYIGYDKDTTIAPYLTVDRNYDYVRINGTLRGPNPLGAYATIVLAVALAALLTLGWTRLRTLQKWVPWLLSGVALAALVSVWYSYSRSALVAAISAAGIVIVLTLYTKAPRRTMAAVGGACLIAAVLLTAFWNTAFVQNVILHENPEGGSSVSSNDEHLASLDTGWQRLLAQPFGAGIGSTGSASLRGENPIIIENQYLFIAHEAGWLGLGLFLALFGVVMYGLWRRREDYLALGLLSSGLGLAAIGLLLPVWVDDTVALVWWGLAAVTLACSPHVR